MDQKALIRWRKPDDGRTPLASARPRIFDRRTLALSVPAPSTPAPLSPSRLPSFGACGASDRVNRCARLPPEAG